MQLGSKEQMSEVFAERRSFMAKNDWQQLYELLDADAMWAYLYSQYYPEEVGLGHVTIAFVRCKRS